MDDGHFRTRGRGTTDGAGEPGPVRLAVVAGLAMYAWELVVATQVRDDFRIEAGLLPPLAAYVGLPALAAAAGARLGGRRGGLRALNGLLAVAVAASAGLQTFRELNILPPTARLAAMVVGAGAALALVIVAGRRARPATRARLWAVAWCLTVGLDRVPRDLFLHAYNFRWAALAAVAGAAVVVAALAGVWFVLTGLAARRPAVGAGLLGGLGVLAVGALSGHGARDAPGPGAPRGDIFLVILDSLRHDRTSLAPAGGDATPALAALAARGASFDDAHSPSTSTEYSLPLITGIPLDPSPFPRTRWTALSSSWDGSLPARLRAAGYRLHLLSDYAATTLRGFDVYRWDSAALRPARAFRLTALLPALWAIATGDEHRLSSVVGGKHPFDARGMAGALDDRLAREERPGFYLIHLAVPHAPYDLPPYRARSLPPAGVDARALYHRFRRLRGTPDAETTAALRALYRRAVRAADEQLAALLAVIERRGRARDALVVVTSDHGEPLGDHGLFGHGRSLFDEAHHVPLVLAGPGVPAGRRVARPVSLTDLPATLLEWAGAAPPAPGSLIAAARGEGTPRAVVVWHPRGTMVQHGRWRLVRTTRLHLLDRPASWNHRAPYELYDLESDPGETTNVYPGPLPIRDALLAALAAHTPAGD